MKRKRMLLVLIVLATAAAGIWFLLRNSDERQIRLLMAKITDTVTKPAGETAAVNAMKTSRCRKLMTDSFSFSSDLPEWKGTDLTASDAAGLLFRMRGNCDSLTAETEVETIQITGNTAAVQTRCRLRGSSGAYRGDFDEVRRALFSLVKMEGRWQIVSAEFTCVLQK